jgi:hypothetical protein
VNIGSNLKYKFKKMRDPPEDLTIGSNFIAPGLMCRDGLYYGEDMIERSIAMRPHIQPNHNWDLVPAQDDSPQPEEDESEEAAKNAYCLGKIVMGDCTSDGRMCGRIAIFDPVERYFAVGYAVRQYYWGAWHDVFINADVTLV